MDCAPPATPVSPGSKPASSKPLNPNLCPKNRVRYTGLSWRAISFSSVCVQLHKCSFHIFRRIFVRAALLTDGGKLRKTLLRFLFLAFRGRNVYPKKSKDVLGYFPVRFRSLQ